MKLSARLAYRTLLLAVLLDLALPFILSFWFPEYSQSKDATSLLGAAESPVSTVSRIGRIIIGILFFFFAIGQSLQFRKAGRVQRLYLFGIIVFALGQLITGVFPYNPPGFSAQIHQLGYTLAQIFLLLCPFWALFIEEFNTKKLYNLLFFIFGLVSFLLFQISFNTTQDNLQSTGLFQRINLLIVYFALIVNFLNINREQ